LAFGYASLTFSGVYGTAGKPTTGDSENGLAQPQVSDLQQRSFFARWGRSPDRAQLI